MFQGAIFSVKVGTTDEITINNGNQGMQRKDLVVARYTYDSAQQKESAEWIVIQGEPAARNPVAPSSTSGDIQEGDTTVDCPVYDTKSGWDQCHGSGYYTGGRTGHPYAKCGFVQYQV